MKTERHVAQRALCLLAIGLLADEKPRNEIKGWLLKADAADALSDYEHLLLGDSAHGTEEKIYVSWSVEYFAPCMWALGSISELVQAINAMDWPSAGLTNELYAEPNAWFDSTQLRSEEQILEYLQLIEQQAWGCRAGAAGRQLFGGSSVDLNSGIVFARLKTLRWIVSEEDDWDAVALNT